MKDKEKTLREIFTEQSNPKKYHNIVLIYILTGLFSLVGGYWISKQPVFEEVLSAVTNQENSELEQEMTSELIEPEENIETDNDTEEITEEDTENIKDRDNEYIENNTSTCTTIDIANYQDLYCYWVEKDDADTAGTWGQKLSDCGVSNFLANCNFDTQSEALKCSQYDYDYAVAFIESAEESYAKLYLDYLREDDEYQNCMYGMTYNELYSQCDEDLGPLITAPSIRGGLISDCIDNHYNECDFNDDRDWYLSQMNKVKEEIAQQEIVLDSCY